MPNIFAQKFTFTQELLHPKMKLSLLTHMHVIPNLYNLSVKHKIFIFEGNYGTFYIKKVKLFHMCNMLHHRTLKTCNKFWAVSQTNPSWYSTFIDYINGMLTAFNAKLKWFLHVLSYVVVPNLISNNAMFALKGSYYALLQSLDFVLGVY